VSLPGGGTSAYRDMTLGQAARIAGAPAFGCACVGPLPVCYCQQQRRQVAALLRAAHIVARQLAEYRDELRPEQHEQPPARPA
jgi:hypothetical protein